MARGDREEAAGLVDRIRQRALGVRRAKPVGVSESHGRAWRQVGAACQEDARQRGEALCAVALPAPDGGGRAGGGVDRGHAAHRGVDVRAVVQQPLNKPQAARVCGDVERRPAERRMPGPHERGLRRHQRNRAFVVPGLQGPEQLVGLRGAAARLLSAALLFPNDGHDLVVLAFGRHRERARRVAVRINADAGVGAVLHEDAHELGRARDHRDVQRAASPGQLGAGLDHRANLRYVAGPHRLDQPFVGGVLHVRPSLLSSRGHGAMVHHLRPRRTCGTATATAGRSSVTSSASALSRPQAAVSKAIPTGHDRVLQSGNRFP